MGGSPNSLIDWTATEKFEQGRQQGKLAPEAVELDKELESERKRASRSPQVAPVCASLTKVESSLDTYE